MRAGHFDSPQLFRGIGGASTCGILVKGSTYLEELSRTGIVVFDKTGTLTQGVFEVTGVYPAAGVDAAALLETAALAESYSKHPISQSLKKACGKELDPARAANVEELGGYGITAQVDGRPVAVGNARLMAKLGLTAPTAAQPGTLVYVAIDGAYAGYILISDVVKPTAAQAIAGLKRAGVRRTVMLTGDAEPVAKAVASQLGIGEYRAGLLPEDKVAQVEALLDEKQSRENLAFVGDGINDAPVLSRADLGIAMGALGSDAAIEAADIVLMDDDPPASRWRWTFPAAPSASSYQNIVFALAVKAGLPGAGRAGPGRDVAGHLRRRRRDGAGRPERHPRPVHPRPCPPQRPRKVSDIPFHLTQNRPEAFLPRSGFPFIIP